MPIGIESVKLNSTTADAYKTKQPNQVAESDIKAESATSGQNAPPKVEPTEKVDPQTFNNEGETSNKPEPGAILDLKV